MVDDYTFTIKTTEPVSNLPVRLGYTAFAPLPDAFFDDPKAFEKKPIGAGPYEVVKYEPGKSAELQKFADYGGDAAKGNVEKITFRMYTEVDAAYNDLLAGNLDVLDDLPTSALVGEKYKQDLGERWDQEAYPGIRRSRSPRRT